MSKKPTNTLCYSNLTTLIVYREICKYFTIPSSYSYKWEQLKNNWKENYNEVIGLHMRRGDFITAMRGDFYLSPSEYASILRNKLYI